MLEVFVLFGVFKAVVACRGQRGVLGRFSWVGAMQISCMDSDAYLKQLPVTTYKSFKSWSKEYEFRSCTCINVQERSGHIIHRV